MYTIVIENGQFDGIYRSGQHSGPFVVVEYNDNLKATDDGVSWVKQGHRPNRGNPVLAKVYEIEVQECTLDQDEILRAAGIPTKSDTIDNLSKRLNRMLIDDLSELITRFGHTSIDLEWGDKDVLSWTTTGQCAEKIGYIGEDTPNPRIAVFLDDESWLPLDSLSTSDLHRLHEVVRKMRYGEKE